MRCPAWERPGAQQRRDRRGQYRLAAASHDFRLLGQGLDNRRIEHRNVKILASFNLLLDIGIDLKMKINFIAGCALKLRAQLPHRGLRTVAA